MELSEWMSLKVGSVISFTNTKNPRVVLEKGEWLNYGVTLKSDYTKSGITMYIKGDRSRFKIIKL